MSAALAELVTAYRERNTGARRFRPEGGTVIGYVGQDVPVELITAAGALPVRLTGDPAIDTTRGDTYLGRGLDKVARSVLTRLMAGDFGSLDGLVISRDCEASLRLFYAIRELRRIDPRSALPPVHLVDLLHLPHRTTAKYNLARTQQLVDQLRAWTGRPITEDQIGAAIADHNLTRSLLGDVAGLRRAAVSHLTGAQALAVIGAGACLPVDWYNNLLQRLLEESHLLEPVSGIRTFLTGSSHDNPRVYEILEAAGLLIVGEDHDWGDLLHELPVAEPTLLGLSERYQYNGPTAQRASITERADYTAMAAVRSRAELLVSYVRDLDEGPPWDFPAQRTEVAAAGIPAVLIDRQTYGSVDTSRLPQRVEQEIQG